MAIVRRRDKRQRKNNGGRLGRATRAMEPPTVSRFSEEIIANKKRKSSSSFASWLVVRRNKGFIVPDLRFLCPRVRIHKAHVSAGLRGCRSQMPSDFFHFLFGGQTLILVERALTNREMNFALDVECPAKDFLLGSAESANDVTLRTGSTQGFTSLWSSPFH
jgi:hypothetical protein